MLAGLGKEWSHFVDPADGHQPSRKEADAALAEMRLDAVDPGNLNESSSRHSLWT